MDLPDFEDDLFEDLGNTWKYSYQKRPPVPVRPTDSIDQAFLKESLRELTTITGTEWVEEAECASKEFDVRSPFTILRAKIHSNWEDVRYNPTVGANIMSASYAKVFLEDLTLTPTTTTLRLEPRKCLEGLGVLHNIYMYHHGTKISLDFHIFDIQEFNVLIGHPLEKLFLELPTLGDLSVKLGREIFTIPIT